MKDELILIGTGGHAKVIIDIIESSTNYKIIGATSNDNIKEFMGYPVLGNDDVLKKYQNKGINNIVIGIGGFINNKLRETVYTSLKNYNFNIVQAVHKSAIISKKVVLGIGCTVFPNVVINTDVVIGNNCIIATSSSIDHESMIDDHVLVSAGVTIGANTIIKSGSLIALGAKVISGITICSNTLIGAGAVVTKDITEPGVYVGIPAKRIK